MNQQGLRILILGAHPDDADGHAGGLAALYCRQRHIVKLVSVTNGESGHHEKYGPRLVDIRRAEASAAGRVIGAEYEVWDFPDGRLEPTLDVRGRVIREIRGFQPDLVLSHRTNDYHPDHRATAQAVCDASYLITVPAIEPDVPILRRPPVFAYMADRFTKPNPLAGDVVVDVGPVFDTLVSMIRCHASQFLEWLPFNMCQEDQVPSDEAGRRQWAARWVADHRKTLAQRYRNRLVEVYGQEKGEAVKYAEVFEISEYAAAMDDDERRRLFPFVP